MARSPAETTELFQAFGRWRLTKPNAGLFAGTVTTTDHGARVQIGTAGCCATGMVAVAFEMLRAAEEAMRVDDAEGFAEALGRIERARAALGCQAPEVWQA